MRRIIAGGFLLLSGVVLYVGVKIAAAIVMPNINGWSTPPGRFGTAIAEINGGFSLVISVLFSILGSVLIVLEIFKFRKYSSNK